MPPAEAEKRCKDIVRRLRWKAPYSASRRNARRHEGTVPAVMRRLDEIEAESPTPGPPAECRERGPQMKKPARGRLLLSMREGAYLAASA